MSFVVYETSSTRIVTTSDTERGAKISKAAQEKKLGVPLSIATLEDYQDIEMMVEKTNLMSGDKFETSVNTPLSCDPSSETYWSM